MVVEPEEVEAVLALGKTGNPRLVGVQLQPEVPEDLPGEAASLLSPCLCRADDDEVVRLCRGPGYAEEGLGLVHLSW